MPNGNQEEPEEGEIEDSDTETIVLSSDSPVKSSPCNRKRSSRLYHSPPEKHRNSVHHEALRIRRKESDTGTPLLKRTKFSKRNKNCYKYGRKKIEAARKVHELRDRCRQRFKKLADVGLQIGKENIVDTLSQTQNLLRQPAPKADRGTPRTENAEDEDEELALRLNALQSLARTVSSEKADSADTNRITLSQMNPADLDSRVQDLTQKGVFDSNNLDCELNGTSSFLPTIPSYSYGNDIEIEEILINDTVTEVVDMELESDGERCNEDLISLPTPPLPPIISKFGKNYPFFVDLVSSEMHSEGEDKDSNLVPPGTEQLIIIPNNSEPAPVIDEVGCYKPRSQIGSQSEKNDSSPIEDTNSVQNYTIPELIVIPSSPESDMNQNNDMEEAKSTADAEELENLMREQLLAQILEKRNNQQAQLEKTPEKELVVAESTPEVRQSPELVVIGPRLAEQLMSTPQVDSTIPNKSSITLPKQIKPIETISKQLPEQLNKIGVIQSTRFKLRNTNVQKPRGSAIKRQLPQKRVMYNAAMKKVQKVIIPVNNDSDSSEDEVECKKSKTTGEQSDFSVIIDQFLKQSREDSLKGVRKITPTVSTLATQQALINKPIQNVKQITLQRSPSPPSLPASRIIRSVVNLNAQPRAKTMNNLMVYQKLSNNTKEKPTRMPEEYYLLKKELAMREAKMAAKKQRMMMAKVQKANVEQNSEINQHALLKQSPKQSGTSISLSPKPKVTYVPQANKLTRTITIVSNSEPDNAQNSSFDEIRTISFTDIPKDGSTQGQNDLNLPVRHTEHNSVDNHREHMGNRSKPISVGSRNFEESLCVGYLGSIEGSSPAKKIDIRIRGPRDLLVKVRRKSKTWSNYKNADDSVIDDDELMVRERLSDDSPKNVAHYEDEIQKKVESADDIERRWLLNEEQEKELIQREKDLLRRLSLQIKRNTRNFSTVSYSSKSKTPERRKTNQKEDQDRQSPGSTLAQPTNKTCTQLITSHNDSATDTLLRDDSESLQLVMLNKMEQHVKKKRMVLSETLSEVQNLVTQVKNEQSEYKDLEKRSEMLRLAIEKNEALKKSKMVFVRMVKTELVKSRSKMMHARKECSEMEAQCSSFGKQHQGDSYQLPPEILRKSQLEQTANSIKNLKVASAAATSEISGGDISTSYQLKNDGRKKSIVNTRPVTHVQECAKVAENSTAISSEQGTASTNILQVLNQNSKDPNGTKISVNGQTPRDSTENPKYNSVDVDKSEETQLEITDMITVSSEREPSLQVSDDNSVKIIEESTTVPQITHGNVIVSTEDMNIMEQITTQVSDTNSHEVTSGVEERILCCTEDPLVNLSSAKNVMEEKKSDDTVQQISVGASNDLVELDAAPCMEVVYSEKDTCGIVDLVQSDKEVDDLLQIYSANRKQDDPKKLESYVSPLNFQSLQTKTNSDDNGTQQRLDPKKVLCQYELFGICNDEQCIYQHRHRC